MMTMMMMMMIVIIIMRIVRSTIINIEHNTQTWHYTVTIENIAYTNTNYINHINKQLSYYTQNSSYVHLERGNALPSTAHYAAKQ